MDLYVVKDDCYILVVKAESWQDAKQKAINWSKNKMSLDASQLVAYACDYNEIIE